MGSFFIFGVEQASANVASGQIQLTNNANDYTIENEFYKAIIPKRGQSASGIIKHLYIVKGDGTYSSDLVDNSHSANYGLGYLEGSGDASANRSYGLSGNATATVVTNTSTQIQIQSSVTKDGVVYNELWSFWPAKPYFQSDSSATRSGSGVLTNQFQFCWMINDTLSNNFYGTDKNGNTTQFTSVVMQPVNSPNLNTYPWVNWQFTGEGVSLGMIFSNINEHLGTIAETGDWPFEYQLDFNLGSGVLGSPVNNGQVRNVTTIYYTANQAANTNIVNFSQNSYQNASSAITQNPITQSAQYINNPYNQNTGNGSALLSAPYFLVRQNTQNRHNAVEHSQYETSIYAPLYKNQQVIHSGSYDFQDQLQYSLNYDNDSQGFTYGAISNSNALNGATTSIQMNATSTDSKLLYNSTFETYSDSDKLKIYGTASNASSTVAIKDSYIKLSERESLTFEAETATPTSAITSTLSTNDNLWTNYNYSYDSGTTLIYQDKGENVPPLAIPINLPTGEYRVTAYVAERPEGSINYKYSTDNSSWSTFSVAQAGANGIKAVDLGTMSINGAFYINDDDDASSGPTNAWAGWDKIVLQPTIQSLGSNIYDLHINDDIYGKMGVAIKVNSPTDNIIISNGTDLLVYLYKQASAQTLTTFSYPFNIEIWPHQGWLSNPSDFTALHSQVNLTYDKRVFYIPDGVHTGRTNTIYSNGAIAYSSDPYTNSSKVDLSLTLPSDSVNVSVNTWLNTGAYHKVWVESSTVSGLTNTVHTIGDLEANKYYNVKVDNVQGSNITGANCASGVCLSNAQGKITFTYTGGYSTHTFDVEAGDNTAPTISSVSSNKANGSYKAGEVVDINVAFSEAVTSTGNVTVTLETGAADRICTFTLSNATSGACNYTVQAGDTSSDLTVNSVSGTIADQVGNAMTNFTPAINLASNKNIVIDTTVPTLAEVTPVPSIANDDTPNYTFTASESGTLAYSGGCASSTASITSGSNTITLSTLTDGTYSACTLILTDTAGNSSAALTLSEFTIDTQAPTLSDKSPDESIFNTDTTQVTLGLTTNENATCRYSASSSMAYSDMVNAFDAAATTNHSVILTNLSSGSDYTYYVRCQDSAGNATGTDYDISFTIAPEQQEDVNLNSIKLKLSKITKELNKNKINYIQENKFTLKGQEEALADGKVKIYVGSKLKKKITVSAQGIWKYVLKLSEDIKKIIKVRHYDQYGTLLATYKLPIKVDTEKPIFTKFIPSFKLAYSGKTTLAWQAADNEKVEHYRIYFNGKISDQKDTRFIIPEDTPSGVHIFKVKAYDESGNAAIQSGWVVVR